MYTVDNSNSIYKQKEKENHSYFPCTSKRDFVNISLSNFSAFSPCVSVYKIF